MIYSNKFNDILYPKFMVQLVLHSKSEMWDNWYLQRICLVGSKSVKQKRENINNVKTRVSE